MFTYQCLEYRWKRTTQNSKNTSSLEVTLMSNYRPIASITSLYSQGIFFSRQQIKACSNKLHQNKNPPLNFFPTNCFSPNNLPSDLPSLLRFLLWTSLTWIPTLAAVSLQNISQAPHSKLNTITWPPPESWLHTPAHSTPTSIPIATMNEKQQLTGLFLFSQQ